MVDPNGNFIIPPFKPGDILEKDPKLERILVLNNWYPGVSESLLKVKGMRCKKIRDKVEPRTLVLLGYRVVGNMSVRQEEMGRVKKIPKPKKTFNGQGFCNEGEDIPVTRDMTVIEGSNPVCTTRGIHFKGNRVMEVKIACPICERPVNVWLKKHQRTFVLYRHKPWDPKRAKKARKRRERQIERKSRRTR